MGSEHDAIGGHLGSLGKRLTLKGASGSEYIFDVHTADTTWNDGVACVYCVSKRDEQGKHTAIYIGETEDIADRFMDHHKQECFERRGYNAISLLFETNERQRLIIEQDLIDALSPPCND